MKLKILELIEYFHADQTQNNNTPFSSEDYEEAIAELEEYKQNFKQKEFDYRTNCQNLVSAERVEADNMPDRLAELEKVILDYYLVKGYQVGVGGWGFNIEIESNYKSKQLLIYFRESMHEHYSQVFKAEVEVTKEMFDKAIEHFSVRQNEVNKCQ